MAKQKLTSTVVLKAQAKGQNSIVWDTEVSGFDLDTLRMPLSAGIVEPKEVDWTERLHRMRGEMEARPFDVAPIGAGGMPLPLAVHAKKLGAAEETPEASPNVENGCYL